MKLAVFTHKVCWESDETAGSYATDGGFPFQMSAISEIFDQTTLVMPCAGHASSGTGLMPMHGHHLRVSPLSVPFGRNLIRKCLLPFWLLGNMVTMLQEIRGADAVHAVIPGDVGSIGMLLAVLSRKPLFVRHCGNWLRPKTPAERFWRWFMERYAGGRNVMFATGGSDHPPSSKNPALQWIFATSMTNAEIAASQSIRRVIGAGGPRCIIVCRQERDKGTDIVLQAMSLLQGKYPTIHLDVVGDGHALDAWRALSGRLNMRASVTFHGRVDHGRVLELLRRADLFCFPTTSSEGFPKAVHEALSCGLPVVASRVSVLPHLIGERCGVILDAVTPECFADAVVTCIDDPCRYRLLSEQAVETALQYSLEVWRDTIEVRLRNAWGPLKIVR